MSARKKPSSTSCRPRSTAARCGALSSRTSAVTRGCSESARARMPPTHISHTSSSRAISSVHGQGVWSTWRPTTCRPTTTAIAAIIAAVVHSRPRPAADRIGAACAPKARGPSAHAPPAATRRRRARAPAACHRASAGARNAPRSISRIVMPASASFAVAVRSSSAPIARWRLAASRAAASSLGRSSAGMRARPTAGGVEAQDAGDVARARHEARDLEEALLQGRARVVLVAVDDAGLERRVDLAEGHRRRARPHQLDGLHVDRRLDRAQLQAAELCRARSRRASA